MLIKSGTEQVVQVSDIEEPPYMITVLSRPFIRSIQANMKNGTDVPGMRPILAECKKRYYPVGNMETVIAARGAKLTRIKCIVMRIDDLKEAIPLHIYHSKSRTYNPIKFNRLMKTVSKEKIRVDMGIIPYGLKRTSDLEPSVERTFEEFVTGLGEKFADIPQMHHIIRPLSRLTEADQKKAINVIIKYTTVEDNKLSPPDNMSLYELLSQFRSIKNIDGGDFDDSSVSNIVRRRKGEPGKGAAASKQITGIARGNGKERSASGAGRKGEEEEEDIEIRPVRKRGGPTSVGMRIPPKSSMIQHVCQCRRRIMINLKNGTIQRMVDNGSNILAINDEENVSISHIVPKEIVEILDLEMSDLVNCYVIKSKPANSVIITKSKISKRVQGEISKIVGKRR